MAMWVETPIKVEDLVGDGTRCIGYDTADYSLRLIERGKPDVVIQCRNWKHLCEVKSRAFMWLVKGGTWEG